MTSKRAKVPNNVLDESDAFKECVRQMQQDLKDSNKMLLEMSHKLDAIIKHLDILYKPSARFVKE